MFESTSKNANIKHVFGEKNTHDTAAAFWWDLKLVGKIYDFVQYSLSKWFNDLFQSGVNVRREEDENPKLNVVADAMKLLAHSFNGLPDYVL